MKAWEIAEDFRTLVSADAAVAEGMTLRTGQSDEDLAFPALVFDCAVQPIGGSANFLRFELVMTVHSEARDEAIAGHAARVEALRRKFFGASQATASAARDAIKAAFDALGHFAMLGRGHDAPAESANGAIEASRFKTPILLAGSVRVLA